MSGKATKLQNEKKHLQQYGKRLEKIAQEHNAYYYGVILPKFEELAAKEKLLDSREAELKKREDELPQKIEELQRIADAWIHYIRQLESSANHKKSAQAPKASKKLMPPGFSRKAQAPSR